jgi:hypothetical protein
MSNSAITAASPRSLFVLPIFPRIFAQPRIIAGKSPPLLTRLTHFAQSRQ